MGIFSNFLAPAVQPRKFGSLNPKVANKALEREGASERWTEKKGMAGEYELTSIVNKTGSAASAGRSQGRSRSRTTYGGGRVGQKAKADVARKTLQGS